MRLGILQCDHVPDDLQEFYGDYLPMFTALLSNVDATLSFQNYFAISEEYPEHIDACDGYLITGSRHSVYEELAWIQKLKEWVIALHQHQKKLVGICFGHQIIAESLGGKVINSEKGWGVGIHASQLCASTDYIDTELTEFSLIVSHQDQVVCLPKEGEVLAKSDFCPIAMMKVRDHIFSTQGHPEFCKGYARSIMEMRRDLLGTSVYQAGMDSLDQTTNALEVARWIVQFFKNSS